jgi:hypothetical protein
MKNIPLILPLGKNLAQYAEITADHRTFTNLINEQYPAHQLQGHKAGCRVSTTTQLGYHGSYLRTAISDTEGHRHQARIHRFHCPYCRQTWTVYPAIVQPGKHYDSYVVQNTLEEVLSLEMSYRAVTRHHQQLSSSGEVKPGHFLDPRTGWRWVSWLGQFALPLVLLACGLMPPDYAVEDEKFLKQNGQKTYAVGLVDHRYDLLWWLDYIFATDQATIEPSLRALTDWLTGWGGWSGFKGITADSWAATRNAFKAICSDTLLAECLLHPLLKFQEEVARFARYTSSCAEEVAFLKEAFFSVLFAEDKAGFEEGLSELESWPEFTHPLLADRLASLRRKQAGLSLHFDHPELALTSSAIDRQFARLERKLASMQQFRTDESGKATLNAWGLVHDFRRYGPGARRAGKSPVELAGVDLEGLPWLQFILIKLSKVQWLKPQILQAAQT